MIREAERDLLNGTATTAGFLRRVSHVLDPHEDALRNWALRIDQDNASGELPN